MRLQYILGQGVSETVQTSEKLLTVLAGLMDEWSLAVVNEGKSIPGGGTACSLATFIFLALQC